MASSSSSLPPDLFDQTTVVSLLATLVLLGVGYGISVRALPASSSGSTRFLFIWHAFDALIHLILEFSFLVNCFFVWIPAADLKPAELAGYYPTPTGFLGTEGRIYGSQAGSNPFAKLWMVYSRADKRWAGSDLTVVSLELLTVFLDGPLAILVCYWLAKKDPRVNLAMIFLAICELYGGWMTFCPEWLSSNVNLDGSNFMYLWVYLTFFNGLWVVFPGYAAYVACVDIMDAFAVRSASLKGKKLK